MTERFASDHFAAYRQKTDRLAIPRAGFRAFRWAAKAPADRLTLPGAAVVWVAGELIHVTGVPWLDAALVGDIALPAIVYGTVLHRSRHRHGQDPDAAAWRAGKATFGALLAGTWAAVSARWGILAGPHGLSSIIYWATTGLAYGIIRADEINKRHRDWRNEKARWHANAANYGLKGSHLLEIEQTRLGHRMLVDTVGTGRRASQLAGRDVGERIAEHKRLPASRVQVTPARIAGQLWVSIRNVDPWAQPIPHPVLDSEPEIELPKSQSIMDPLIVGLDPETGKPLEVSLYDDEYGAHGLLIVAMTGGGKTVLLNCLMERLTACDDVLVWDINLSKGKENRRWAAACDLTAHGPRERAKALQILRLALKVIEYRGQSDESDEAIHVPTREDPAIVIRVDEMDALQAGDDGASQAIQQVLNKINSKKRSEGVILIEAGQRATSSYGGTTDIRANFTTYAIANTRTKSEAMYAAGDDAFDLPDMSSYGEGHPGVWVIGSVGAEYQTGRTFYLKHLRDLAELAAARPPRAVLSAALRDHLGDAYIRAKTGTVPAYSVDPEQLPEWMAAIEKDLVNEVGSDLLGAMDEMDRVRAQNERTGQELDQLAADEVPEVRPEIAAMVAHAKAERSRQAAMSVDIPDAHRTRLLTILRGGEAASGDLAMALQVSRPTVWRYLARLRAEGLIDSTGKGRGARWIATGEAPRDLSG